MQGRVQDTHQKKVDQSCNASSWGVRYKWQVFFCLAVICSLTGTFIGVRISQAASIDSSEIRVIDGDTIRLHQKRPDVRLVGFNAPETRNAMLASSR